MVPPPPQNRALGFKFLATEAELDRLAVAWQALLATSASPELMQDFRWQRGWWRHYGATRTLAIGTFYDGCELVGIAPCCRRTFSYRLGIRLQRLELMGANEGEADGVCSEYLGLIARRGYEHRVADTFVAAMLAGGFGRWDECVLEMLNGDSPMFAHLNQALSAQGLALEQLTTMEAPFVTLPSDWAAFERTLGKKRRQAVKYAMRDFATWAGERGYTFHRATDAATFQQGFAILRKLHAERWQSDMAPSAFEQPRFLAFHDVLARQLLDANQLHLTWLTVGDEPVAAHYSFTGAADSGRIHFYQSGRRMDVPNTVRLGIVMMTLVIQDAIARGAREFDMLGGKAQYKMLFTRTTRPLVRLRVARPSWREHLRRSLVSVRNFARPRTTSPSQSDAS